MKDTFNFKLSDPIKVFSKEKSQGELVDCNELILKSTVPHLHKYLELELQQIFVRGQFSLADVAKIAQNPVSEEEQERRQKKQEEQEKKMSKEELEKLRSDTASMAYFLGYDNMEKLINKFKELFCGKNPVCFVDSLDTPLSKKDFDKISAQDTKDLICRYTAVFFMNRWQ